MGLRKIEMFGAITEESFAGGKEITVMVGFFEMASLEIAGSLVSFGELECGFFLCAFGAHLTSEEPAGFWEIGSDHGG